MIRTGVLALVGAAGAAATLALAGCATTAPASAAAGATTGGGSGAAIRVVAAENFWGSIAAQLGGTHVRLTSIITNPNTDPHSYEPTAADARAVAGAQLLIENGVGYDTWAGQLAAANPESGRTVLNVGDLVGVKAGGNPHRWYSRADVYQVIDQITADYVKADPADAGYFQQQKTAFENVGLAQYNALIDQIRQRYAGTPIGASESIVTPLAETLGLDMLTPETFLDAISEGTDPTVADKTAIDAQIRNKKIKVYVYNSQNATPDVQAQVDEAKAENIPVATVTETLAPAGDTFQEWQVGELRGLEQVLAKATGH